MDPLRRLTCTAAALGLVASLGPGTSTTAAQTAPQLPRVYVHTDPAGDSAELRDRQQSVKDLRAALAVKKKDLVVIDNKERADLAVEVMARSTVVPKVRIGLTSPGTSGPGRVVRLRITVTRGGDSTDFTNKNTPFEANRGWQAAAEDLATQVDKWIRAHK